MWEWNNHGHQIDFCCHKINSIFSSFLLHSSRVPGPPVSCCKKTGRPEENSLESSQDEREEIHKNKAWAISWELKILFLFLSLSLSFLHIWNLNRNIGLVQKIRRICRNKVKNRISAKSKRNSGRKFRKKFSILFSRELQLHNFIWYKAWQKNDKSFAPSG